MQCWQEEVYNQKSLDNLTLDKMTESADLKKLMRFQIFHRKKKKKKKTQRKKQ